MGSSAISLRWGEIGFYFDGASALMLALVSFVGWLVCRFSDRYLTDDPKRSAYYRWTGFTIGTVMLMTLSSSLLMFSLCWALTSLGLHHLLLHFPDRAGAQRAAWSKFVVSRTGDFFLALACLVCYLNVGTTDFATLFSHYSSADSRALPASESTIIGWLLILGAAIKSVQFPFHTWLPLTMETPTPVSALMHGGIVNAGGFLLIRTQPLLIPAPNALLFLTIVGTTTAVFASLVMLTQTNIKRMLAYSTIAQMGFMMLQCGLGIFAAAMLHLIAHSLYKAHAFLSSGTQPVRQAANVSASISWGWSGVSKRLKWQTYVRTVGVMMLVAATITTVAFLPLTHPNAWPLIAIMSCAITAYVYQSLRTLSIPIIAQAFLRASLLVFLYVASFRIVDAIISTNPQYSLVPVSSWGAIIVVTGFVLLTVIQWLSSRLSDSPFFHRLYVHLSNGLYIDSLWRKALTGSAMR
jgi:NAD(P)H-quinone oxidoreductase subunit 5